MLLNSMTVQNLSNTSGRFIQCRYPKGLHWKTLGCWIKVAKYVIKNTTYTILHPSTNQNRALINSLVELSLQNKLFTLSGFNKFIKKLPFFLRINVIKQSRDK